MSHKKLTLRFTLLPLLALIVMGGLSGCGNLNALPARGQVFVVVNPEASRDAWKYAPSENTQVVVTWTGFLKNDPLAHSLHSSGRCVKAVTVLTGKDGRFAVPGWSAPSAFIVAADVVAAIHVYRSGFVEVHGVDYSLPPNARPVPRAPLPDEALGVFDANSASKIGGDVVRYHIIRPSKKEDVADQMDIALIGCPT